MLKTLRALVRLSCAPVKGAKNGMPLSITLGSMASIMGVPMQLNSAKYPGSARNCSIVASALGTSWVSSCVTSSMVLPWMPPRALMPANAALAPWCMADPRSPSGPVRAVDCAIRMAPSCARALPRPSQGRLMVAVAAASNWRRAMWDGGRAVVGGRSAGMCVSSKGPGLRSGGRGRRHHPITIGIFLSVWRQLGSWYSRTSPSRQTALFHENLRAMDSRMNQDLSLHQRRRPPTADELDGIPWLRLLLPAERERAVASLLVGDAKAGGYVGRGGRPGAWFGEGTTIKREPYRYNIQALRKSVVAGLPIDSFHWLLDHSIGFNRFVMNQLNERLGQFIAAREIDRLNNPDVRVARSLASLFNPVLYPGVGEVLRITQQELAYLVGLSRQRVNEALAALEAQGAIRVESGGVRVLDLAALRSSVFPP